MRVEDLVKTATNLDKMKTLKSKKVKDRGTVVKMRGGNKEENVTNIMKIEKGKGIKDSTKVANMIKRRRDAEVTAKVTYQKRNTNVNINIIKEEKNILKTDDGSSLSVGYFNQLLISIVINIFV